MSTRTIVIIGVLLVAALLTGCGSKCTKEAYLEKVEPIVEKWDDALDIADSTPRMSLAPQVSKLQEIRRETADLEISECAQEAHAKLLDYMDGIIDGFVAFLGSEDEDKVNRIFKNAFGDFDDWENLVEAIGQ